MAGWSASAIAGSVGGTRWRWLLAGPSGRTRPSQSRGKLVLLLKDAVDHAWDFIAGIGIRSGRACEAVIADGVVLVSGGGIR